jgi:YesN/AraC family two-component response regulator
MNHESIENIFEASTGNEAVELIRHHHIDIVFMDIEMPDMNGIEATRLATEQNRFIVIIALSFHKEMQYVMQMLEAGARNYIIKEDINPQTLKKVFENSLV